jgi:hypothetical protein
VTSEDFHHLQRSHVFGCPVFVLDPKLQDAKKLPKWSMRSCRGVYLGVSKHHSSTVHMVLNPATGAISPQYHVVFDDPFSTVFSDGQFDRSIWESLVQSNREFHQTVIKTTDGTLIIPPDHRPFDASVLPPSHDGSSEPSELPISTPTLTPPPSLVPEGAPIAPEGAATTETLPIPLPPIPQQPTPSIMYPQAPISPSLRRSSRRNKGQRTRKRLIESCSPIFKYISTNNISIPYLSLFGSSQTSYENIETDQLPQVPKDQLDASYISGLKWDCLTTLCYDKLSTLQSFIIEHQQNLTVSPSRIPLVKYFNPALYMTVANSDNTPNFTEAMNGPDSAGFFKAMQIEIETLIIMEAFIVVDRESWMKVVSGVWAFKRKRFPDCKVRKLKARFCARGFEQLYSGE